MKNYLLIIFCLLAFSFNGRGHARIPYNHFADLSAEELYARAADYSNRQMSDSALACFSLCGLKYSASLSRPELELTVNAMRKEAQLYFYNFYEYETACNRLAQAIQLCKLNKLDNILPQILMEQAGVYYTYASQNPDSNLFKKAEDLYLEAFRLGYEMNDKNVMATTMANLLPQYHNTGRLEELKEEMKMFGEKMAGDTTLRFKFAVILYNGINEVMKGNQSKAREIFLREEINDLKPRHQFKIIVSAVRTYLSENKIDSAILLEHRLLNICDRYGLKDGRSVVLRDLGNLYYATGDSVNGKKYELLGLQSKDTLINVNHLDKAANMAFLEEMHQLHEDMSRNKRKTTTMILIIAALVIVIVVASVVWIKINRRNRKAMANAVAAIDALKKKQEENRESHPETSEETPKYSSSNMDEYTRRVLTERIQNIFSQDNDSIYSQGFCIDDVAKAVKSNSKYVSQIINQYYGCNFSTLLSTLRAREAARRIADPNHYGNLTFEAIGASVGFGSRAAFNAAFKRLTGKTPRDYRNSMNDSLE